MAHYQRPESQRRPAAQARPLTDFVGRPGSLAVAPAAVKREPRAGGPSPREELKICGLAAVKARFERDPASILRLFFDEPTSRKVGAMSQVLAAAKKVYRCVPPAELEKISGSIHHGGIVAIVQVPALRAPTAEQIRSWAQARATVLILDRIGNAHNLGAIARTAAFFGVERIVLAEAATAARPTEAAHRVAEGGLEYVELWQVKNIAALAKDLAAAGYEVIGAATRGGRPEAVSGAKKPVALVMGNEEEGLAPAVVAACTRLVTIPGTGKVESLNVSVAAAVLLWECCARRTGGSGAGS
ncbi:MAG: RNA methyltransferase [Opitutaceae bacterium]|nr:RNA methyltransferase [Opitutaceae bacterium]